MNSEPANLPVDIRDIDVSHWTGDRALPLRLAQLWARYVPRGKGVFPRLVGRTIGRTMHCWIPTKRGARLAVAPASLDSFAAILNNGGTWNEHVFSTCAQRLAKGGVFYDIGANVGYMSIEMAHLFAGQALVVAFEPQPDLSHAVALSARLNGFSWLKVFDVMLGETEASGKLFVGSHQIHASAVPREKRCRIIECRVTTIDNMVERGEIPPPNVMKIDIEGGELAALRGARKTLGIHRPVIVFECDANAARFGYSRRDIVDYLSGISRYDFRSIVEDATLIPLDAPYNGGSRVSDDVLATPLHV